MQQLRHESAVDGAPTPVQMVRREVNSEIFKVASRLDKGNDLFSLVCECDDIRCSRRIDLHLHRFDPTTPPGSLVAHVPHGEREQLI